MPEIFVDADACPVKDEVVRVAERHGLRVYMVSNQWMRLPPSAAVERVVVTDGFDAADNWIAERAAAGDIVITADIPLADRCLKRAAKVIGPTGKPFTESGIGMAVAIREVMTTLRDTGEIKGYNKSFSKRDRSTFLQALENAVQASLRGR